MLMFLYLEHLWFIILGLLTCPSSNLLYIVFFFLLVQDDLTLSKIFEQNKNFDTLSVVFTHLKPLCLLQIYYSAIERKSFIKG